MTTFFLIMGALLTLYLLIGVGIVIYVAWIDKTFIAEIIDDPKMLLWGICFWCLEFIL